jgi:predicted signal transduction protein with EAL and GGDEF domain
MERWGGANHPLVKAVAGFSVPLFLALNFPTIFLAILAAMLLYAIGLLGVVHAYRRRYRIVGRPELALQLAAKSFSSLKENISQTMTRGLANHQNRKHLQQERKAKLRRSRRERNRRKRQQAREALVHQE